jgi:hypothetical protein
MVSEKKFDLELDKRNKIIDQLRKDRNNIIVKYQALNETFIKIFDELDNIQQKISNKDLENKINDLKLKFKDHF